ncbi:cupin domain-containing protein [Streptomyces pseudogriseolus]|uniref:cupin domain-containing protein n=1 Tax=Streptomyces pseudogriseolus TaxID=36817 RepID=UPI001CE2AC26|nr:cupin domain-containing protein [Streptomyces pseudogriseolus]
MSETGSKTYSSDATYVPESDGTVKWVVGDEYNIKLSGEQSHGTLSFVVATVPPGNGPVAHIHENSDEAFYLIEGELEFLNGETILTAKAGDFIFVPRGTRHRFKNRSPRPTKMVFLFTPAGPEQFFLRYGDDPLPGHEPELWTAERFTPQMLEFSRKLGTVQAPEPE